MISTALFPKLRLRGLILILAIVSVLVTLANSFYATYKIQRQLLIDNTLEANRVYATKLATVTDIFLDSTQHQLAYSARLLSANIDQPSVLAEEVHRLHQQSKVFNSVVVVDAHSRVLETSPKALDIKGKVIDKPAILQSPAVKKPLITKPFISEAGNYLLSMSHPIINRHQQYLGYISGTIYLEENNILNTILGQHYYNDGSYLYVVDSDKTIIYHPDPQRIGDKVADNPAIDAVINGQMGAFAIKNSLGIEMLAGFSPIAHSDWGVVSQRPIEATLAELDGHILNVFVKSVPLIVAILIGIWLSARLISKPLQELANQARLMDNQESHHKIDNIHSWYFEATQLKRSILKGMGLLHDKISRLHTDSHTDLMTGLLNRRGMQQLLNQYQVTTQPFSVITIDIDFFKQVNDTYGHDVGDIVLKELAGIMKENARQNDAVCRSGGEEFILLLPDSTADAAFAIAERLRKQVERHPMPNGVGFINISLGVATWPGHLITVSQALKYSDQALYQAKKQGRNRTIVAKQVS